MKIVASCNYGKETVSDFLVAENITIESDGQIMVKALNDSGGDHAYYYYKLVPDEYILYEFKP